MLYYDFLNFHLFPYFWFGILIIIEKLLFALFVVFSFKSSLGFSVPLEHMSELNVEEFNKHNTHIFYIPFYLVFYHVYVLN